VDGKSGDSYADDERPVGGRPYLEGSGGNTPPRRIPRSHGARRAPHHGNVYQFPRQPRAMRSHGMADAVDRRAVGQPPGREAGGDLETTDTIDLSRGGFGSWNVQQQAPPTVPRQQSGLPDNPPRPTRHARRAQSRKAGGTERRRRLTLQAAYIVALGMTSYLLLGGLGLVALPFDPASLLRGGESPGSDQPATSPGPVETFTSPGAGPLTEESPPVPIPTSASAAATPSPTPIGTPTSGPTARSTPSATASPTPTKKHPTPPGQTRKPTKPPPH
jgi:hypothetical protein